MNTLDKVNQEVRPSFEKNVSYVQKYLYGRGADIGCGSCPLLNPICAIYADQSEQPIAVESIKKAIKTFYFDHKISYPITPKFFICDGFDALNGEDLFEFIFSSHMLEDLPSVDDVIKYLNIWSTSLSKKGHIVLLFPDIENGRYPKSGEPGSNPSHHIDIGPKYFKDFIFPELVNMKIVQIDTIPYTSETFDVVLERRV